jgi:hypothetical protein
VISIAVIRVWIRCEECGCTWRDKPASLVLRRLFGRPLRWFARRSQSGHVATEEVSAAAGTPMPPAQARRGRALASPLSSEDLERWFEGCDRDFTPQARVSPSVNDWLLSDPFAPPAEQPAGREHGWVPPSRPTMQGTFVERLDALHSGLVRLETFVLKCSREEEASARRLDLTHK